MLGFGVGAPDFFSAALGVGAATGAFALVAAGFAGSMSCFEITGGVCFGTAISALLSRPSRLVDFEA